MAIILKKLKGKPVSRDKTTADWDRLIHLLKILFILFVVFSSFHWIIKKKANDLPIIPALSRIQSDGKSTAASTKIYTVRSGDTLWSIAAKQYPNESPEKIVKEIAKLNQLSNHSIRPGQPLKLPISK